MNKTLTGIIAASAVYLASCAAPHEQMSKESSSVAQVSSLARLARDVYSIAEKSPDGVIYFGMDRTQVTLTSVELPVPGNIRFGEITLDDGFGPLTQFSDYGEDGELNNYFVGTRAEGAVVFEPEPQELHQQEYVDLLQRVKAALESQR